MNNPAHPHLFVSVPLIDELELFPRLIRCISLQTCRNFNVFFCINQPDEWWNDPEKRGICENNVRTFEYLSKQTGFEFSIIDRFSSGKGWQGKRHGVGWARKTLMDTISEEATPEDIILSLDADVVIRPRFFESVLNSFVKYPDAVAMAIPYYHNPVDNPDAYRAILRYEIYMRYYSLNLWRISSPYTFTALGSALACTVGAYRTIGGMTPKMSGEDFYFLQKLRKFGKMIFWNPERVYPEGRFSNRVYFGTGPAMIKGDSGDWSSYPIYPVRFFDEIEETCRLFPEFFLKTEITRITSFLKDHLHEEDPFLLIRENSKNKNQFVRACHEKFDGLRTLQYLKFRISEEPQEDEKSLKEYLFREYPQNEIRDLEIDFETFQFNIADLTTLERIRNFLTKKEEDFQINSIPSLPGQQLPGE